MNLPINQVIQGDCLNIMRQWPDEYIDCCVTSPPYWGLRNYKSPEGQNQLGLESTPELYIQHLVEIFREVRRVLKKSGTFWLNIGDSYISAKGRCSSCPQTLSKHHRDEPINGERPDLLGHPVLKDKDLAMIPAQLAIALRNDGWWLRQDIIWAKPNPMPESVTDRCTRSHEYIFLLTKSPKYYFDNEAIKEDSVDEESYKGRRFRGRKAILDAGALLGGKPGIHDTSRIEVGKKYPKRNKRDVWFITVNKSKECRGHFAVFPEKLIEPCILAGCPWNGIVLDPFIGSGTTALVAKKLGRNYIGIEISEEYCKIARERCNLLW